MQSARPSSSKPIHLQRIENALSLWALERPQNEESESEASEEEDDAEEDRQDLERERSDDGRDETSSRICDAFDLDDSDPERMWLLNILKEKRLRERVNYRFLLRMRLERKKISFSEERRSRSAYYGAGLLSMYDKYPEIKKMRSHKRAKRKGVRDDSRKLPNSVVSDSVEDVFNEDARDCRNEGRVSEDEINTGDTNARVRTPKTSALANKRRVKRFGDEEAKRKWEDIMTAKRRKLFAATVKKEVGKQHRAKTNRHKEMLIQCKKSALQCQKVVRQKALQSARVVKEQQWRMKRLARENLAYWKRSKRVDREIRRKLEREAEEQRKMDFELVEAKRQQRKLNFLITQTELYAHFMSKKLGSGSQEERLRILKQLDEEKNPRLANIDDYDSDAVKARAIKNAEEAFRNERARTRNFDVEANSNVTSDGRDGVGEHAQPALFRGSLKGYQLRGMNWLANLYDQGISGILADEMGLGKTVQSIAFLCHVAEKYSVWGPFLVISPASTLHNWQQELDKFVPDFKVVPYWGNPNERKILRQFWDQKAMHTREASFHIVVTSYQIVITDIKYFNRIKWQYMILDEAQAIKSTSSMRWKTLLGFSCRNRLLLSGTPIQNSMAELWALLHFIMPTLFDSHEEFNEWFSKDIESHAENKTGIDEKHLSRLHMILKPFMLRRIKKDVENELSDKIEVMVYCPLTTRQKLLYMALKQKIRIEDLLHYTVGGGDSHVADKNFTSNLMNLVMQFRKVCNHPELFERRDAKSPIYIPNFSYEIPHLVYEADLRKNKFLTILKYLYFTPDYIASAMKSDRSLFNFAFALKLSPQDIYRIQSGDILHRWKNYYDLQKEEYLLYHRKNWSRNYKRDFRRVSHMFPITSAAVNSSPVLENLLFAWKNTSKRFIYAHLTHVHYSMAETLEHRNIRRKNSGIEDFDAESLDEKISMKANHERLPYEERPAQQYFCEATPLPSFLFCGIPKIATTSAVLYCYSRRAAWEYRRFVDDFSLNSIMYYWKQATDNVHDEHNFLNCFNNDLHHRIFPAQGCSHIVIPDKETLVTDSGKLSVLDGLLKRLKEEGHRVLIYSQMTKMIDLLEEYMWHRHHKYMRLDGSSKISERRDMVADFQARTDIFVFLLSTRAGGLGINLTAADTVIFYDSDWNPTVDQQAMDRAHRLGQTKQVTVYRLICKGSIEERILQRAREKSEIQKLVISGGNFKPDTLKPKEVVSLLLDDEEIEQKYRQRTEERKQMEDMREMERKKKQLAASKNSLTVVPEVKKIKQEINDSGVDDQSVTVDSGPSSPYSDTSAILTISEELNDNNFLEIEGDSSINKYTVYNLYGSTVKPRIPGRGTAKRGRPRGSRRVSALGRFNGAPSTPIPSSSSVTSITEVANEIILANSTGGSPVDFPASQMSYGSPTVRRGPGRPRLKPSGPAHTGTRGTYRPRKPARPLPVPLPTDCGNNLNNSSTNIYSSYLYDYNDQSTD